MSYTNILNSQSVNYKNVLNEQISSAVDKNDVYHIQTKTFKEFFNGAFKSSLYKEVNSKLSKDYFVDITNRSISDVAILFEEGKTISKEISDQFNISKDHRTRSKNKVEYLLSLVSNLNIINRIEDNAVSFYDSLSNYNFIEDSMIIGTKATISTSEGLAHLATKSSSILSKGSSVITINGNGILGNQGLITPLTNPLPEYGYKYISDIDSHSEKSAMIDGQNNTWFEYQKIGSTEIPTQTRIDEREIWTSSQSSNDSLFVTINIDLISSSFYNWLDISQYIPDDSRNGIIINKINTSLDGINWDPLYPDLENIDQRIYSVPQMFDISESSTINKAMSQGTFIFALKKIRYLQIIISNDSSCTKERSLGYTKYSIGETQVPKQSLPEYITLAPQGTYTLDNGTVIVKKIIPVSGWRYCIGIRDIELSKREYSTSSVLVTKLFKTEKPIKKIALYASEMIPAEFANYGIKNKQAWIKYSFSYDDKTWYPISPIHHNPVGEEEISPKFYDFNSNITMESRDLSINSAFIEEDKPVTSIRLKIEFNRPDELFNSTPILQAYTLKCFTEEN